MKKIGIALGGGGAKGLAHIPMLEVLDELGVRPHAIAGTSIGSIMGVLYASGMSAAQMREGIGQLTETPRTLKELFEARELPAWLDFIGIELGRSSLLNVDHFLAELAETIGVSTFEELEIPLKIVAADFWARAEVVFESGPIIPAVAASFALPGIFKPIVMGEQVLVDGGSTNPVPYDLLQDECDIVVAVDVLGQRKPGEELLPSYAETIFNTFQISEQSILNAKMKASPPSVYVEPGVENVKVLEFHRAPEIYEQAKPAAQKLRRELAALLD